MIVLIGLPVDLILKFCGMISLFIYIIGLECVLKCVCVEKAADLKDQEK